MKIINDCWNDCYPSRWKGIIVPEAIAHPAKFSSKLIRRIYEHMIAEGWLIEGDTVIDPFGGVALGALDAMRLGLRWIGMELEPRFVDLGNQNIAAWNTRFSSMPHWGDAVLIQGDSRNLAQVLGMVEGCVSSPPFAECLSDHPSNNILAGGLRMGASSMGNGYGLTSGNLGNMKSTAAGLQAAVSSPPYADNLNQTTDGIDWSKGQGGRDFSKEPGQAMRLHMGKGYSAAVASPPYADGGIHQGGDDCLFNNSMTEKYGATPGQLGAMKANGFEAAVSSPPYIETVQAKTDWEPTEALAIKQGGTSAGRSAHEIAEYVSPGNLGNSTGDDFWSAARVIVEQVYQVLVLGGHAVWVVKAFVKNKERVDFPGQWRQLCEAVGFVTLHEHHAMLVHSTSTTFDGREVRKESKSFFRRLAENKGSPRIDFEVVLCMEKV